MRVWVCAHNREHAARAEPAETDSALLCHHGGTSTPGEKFPRHYGDIETRGEAGASRQSRTAGAAAAHGARGSAEEITVRPRTFANVRLQLKEPAQILTETVRKGHRTGIKQAIRIHFASNVRVIYDSMFLN